MSEKRKTFTFSIKCEETGQSVSVIVPAAPVMKFDIGNRRTGFDSLMEHYMTVALYALVSSVAKKVRKEENDQP